METQIIQSVIDVNSHLFKGECAIQKVKYLAINVFGWVRCDTVDECIAEMTTNHKGRAKWADPKTKKNMPYRIFMLFDDDSRYTVSPSTSSLGLSENGIPTLLIADTYNK